MDFGEIDPSAIHLDAVPKKGLKKMNNQFSDLRKITEAAGGQIINNSGQASAFTDILRQMG